MNSDPNALLKKVFVWSNSEWDSENKRRHWNRPDDVTERDWQWLIDQGHDPNVWVAMTHDQAVAALQKAAALVDERVVADGFLFSLGGKGRKQAVRDAYRPGLYSWALGSTLPTHEYEPFSTGRGSKTCNGCGTEPVTGYGPTYQRWAFETRGAGALYDAAEHAYVLELTRELPPPEPSDADRAVLRAILELIGEQPPRTRYSYVVKAMTRAKLPGRGNKWHRATILEHLALCGVLETEDYPGLLTRFTPWRYREARPNSNCEVAAPLSMWSSSEGVNVERVNALFPGVF